jgi:hypothetical protein
VRRVGRNILPAGASGKQMPWERICVVIMFSRIHLGRRTASNRLFESMECSVTRRAPDPICGMSNLNLRFGYSERRNNGRLFPNISDCGSSVYCLIFGRRIRRLARLHPLLGGAPRSVLSQKPRSSGLKLMSALARTTDIARYDGPAGKGLCRCAFDFGMQGRLSLRANIHLRARIVRRCLVRAARRPLWLR